MIPNDPVAAEYRDLLDDTPEAGAAGELLPVIAALDALYAAPVPQAIQERFALAARDPAEAVMMTLDDDEQVALPVVRRHLGAAAAMPIPTPAQGAWSAPHRLRRRQGFAALAAAALVVALMAAVLHMMIPGGVGSMGGETAQQRFARLGGMRIVLSDAAWSVPLLRNGVGVDTRRAWMAQEPILRGRFTDALGVSDPIFSQQDQDYLVIELPGVGKQQAQEVKALLAPGDVDAYLTLTEVPSGTQGEGVYPGTQAFTGDDVDPASVAAQLDPQSGQPIVVLALKPAPRAAFAQLTASHIGDYLTVFLDSTAVESATLQSQIDGSFDLVGFPTMRAARDFAAFLKYGPTQTNGIESITYVAPQG